MSPYQVAANVLFLIGSLCLTAGTIIGMIGAFSGGQK